MPNQTRKTSVSLDIAILPRAKARAKERGFKHSFSAYLADLIEKDLREAETGIVVSESSPPYRVKRKR